MPFAFTIGKEKKMQINKLTCPECGIPLIQSRWNSRVDILYCGNWDCTKFHSPAGKVITNRGGNFNKEKYE